MVSTEVYAKSDNIVGAGLVSAHSPLPLSPYRRDLSRLYLPLSSLTPKRNPQFSHFRILAFSHFFPPPLYGLGLPRPFVLFRYSGILNFRIFEFSHLSQVPLHNIPRPSPHPRPNLSAGIKTRVNPCMNIRTNYHSHLSTSGINKLSINH